MSFSEMGVYEWLTLCIIAFTLIATIVIAVIAQCFSKRQANNAFINILRPIMADMQHNLALYLDGDTSTMNKLTQDAFLLMQYNGHEKNDYQKQALDIIHNVLHSINTPEINKTSKFVEFTFATSFLAQSTGYCKKDKRLWNEMKSRLDKAPDYFAHLFNETH